MKSLMTKKLLIILTCLFTVTVLSACFGSSGEDEKEPVKAEAKQAPEVENKVDPARLADFVKLRTFTLKSIDNKALGADFMEAPSLIFGENSLVAGKICNNYRGTGSLEGNILKVSPVLSTRMACPGAMLNQFEQDFFRFLESGFEVSQEGEMLKLKSGDRSFIFEVAK